MKKRQTAVQQMKKTVFLSVLFFIFTSVLPGGKSVWAELPASTEILKDGGSLIADIAERRVAGVVNISSSKLIKTDASQLMHPFFNDPFFRDFWTAFLQYSKRET